MRSLLNTNRTCRTSRSCDFIFIEFYNQIFAINSKKGKMCIVWNTFFRMAIMIFMCYPYHLFYWLDCTNFIVSKHYGYQTSILQKFFFQIFRIDKTIFVYWKITYLVAFFFKVLVWFKYSVMLN